jgi:ABC-type Fe3+-siderophore transport system permease subunit
VSDSPWAGESSRRAGAPSSGRVIEIITVLLLALATVGSAWSAFQVSGWNGVETDEARVSGAYRIDASREYALATQTIAYDAAAVSQYAQAISSDDERLQQFIRETIIRPDFLPIIDAWTGQIEAGEQPTNLIQNEDYLDELLAPSRDHDANALAASVRSEEAGDNADDYIRLTIFFASALFFAGVTASFRTRLPKLVLLMAAGVILAVAGVLLARYPIA